jgi:hypothetical protein
VLATLLVATLVLTFAIGSASTPLITDEARVTLLGMPHQGMVALELAGDERTVVRILRSWDPPAHILAAFTIGLGFLYFSIYSTMLGLAALWTSRELRRRGWPLAAVGVPLAWGQWIAALLDAAENITLIVILLGLTTTPWPEIARACAIPKFLLIGCGILYFAYGLVARFTAPSSARD